MGANVNKSIKLVKALDALNKNDTYSMLLFALYKLRDDPEYLPLSELSYVLDNENLSKFLSYFGGMTLKIPTMRDMRLVIQGLVMYQLITFDQLSFEEALRGSMTEEFTTAELKEMYARIVEVLTNYEFTREQ